MTRAVALVSGGLDSTLAAWLVREQGVELYGLTFRSAFHPGAGDHLAAQAAAEFLGIPLKVVNNTDRLLAHVKSPKHGYGSNLNPCIDCRIDLLREAKSYLTEIGGQFIVTGEVLGQRPMSQRRDAMRLIDQAAGVVGVVVRPLCARLLKPTLPEQHGLIDRDKLLDIRGRGRRRQMDLAQQIGLTDYPSPAGGCLLTDPGFCVRMAELVKHADPTPHDVELLKVGRHFRLDDGAKVVVGRDDADNQRLRALAREGDVLLELDDIPGPTTVLRGRASDDNIDLAAALTARYSKAKDLPSATVRVTPMGDESSLLTVDPQLAAELNRIGISN